MLAPCRHTANDNNRKSDNDCAYNQIHVIFSCFPHYSLNCLVRQGIVYNNKFLAVARKQQHANIIFSHETAHRYDALKIKSWENEEFVNAIETAINKIKDNLKKYNDLYESLKDVNPALQDILSALSDNKIKVTYGHNWTNMKNKALEIFANTSYLQANHIELPQFDGLLDDIMIISKTMFIKGAN